MKFTLVYYETVRIERTVEAATVEEAIAIGLPMEGWDDCDETSLGTNGVELVLDASGTEVYNADGTEEKK